MRLPTTWAKYVLACVLALGLGSLAWTAHYKAVYRFLKRRLAKTPQRCLEDRPLICQLLAVAAFPETEKEVPTIWIDRSS
jgi:hypothetical protein